jgi:hypothetical protein
MKCSRPGCSLGIGQVSYQRSLLDKRRFCSEKCRDNFVKQTPKKLQKEHLTPSYFDWLLSRPTMCPCAGTNSLRRTGDATAMIGVLQPVAVTEGPEPALRQQSSRLCSRNFTCRPVRKCLLKGCLPKSGPRPRVSISLSGVAITACFDIGWACCSALRFGRRKAPR